MYREMTQSNKSETGDAIVEASKKRERMGLLVLGMHRSGTSLLSRLLSLYGCDLPRNLLPANEANSEGYWESSEIVNLNDQLLSSGGSKWHDWLSFNPRWYDSLRKNEYLDQASAVLKQEFGHSSLFVLKDPRICRLVPFWLEVLEQEGIQPGIVVPVRHPALVARSLTLRDGIQSPVGQLLWLRHVLDAEAASRGRPRTFLTFNQLLEKWQELPDRISADLGVQWPRAVQANCREQAEFIKPDMAHSEIALQNRPVSQNMPEAVEQAWGIFARWAEVGEDRGNYATLNDLRDSLDRVGEIADEAITISMNTNWLFLEQKQKITEVDAQIEALRGVAAERERVLQNAQDKAALEEEANAALTAERDDARLKASEAESQNRHLSHEIDKMVARLAIVETSSKTVEADRDRLVERCEELQAKLSLTESNLRQRYAEIDHLRHELDIAGDAAGQARAAEKVAQAALVDSRTRLSEAIAHNAHLDQDILSIRLRIGVVEAARDEANRRNIELQHMADALRMQDARIVRLTEELMQAREEEKDRVEQSRQLAAELEVTLEQQQWLLAVNHLLVEPGRWWVKFLSPSRRERLVLRRLARVGLFDGEAYLARYEDVAQSGINPLQHYIRHGMIEGRIRT